MDTSALKIKVPLIFLAAVLVLGVMFFVPAGTLDYWQGWVYMAVIFIPAFFVLYYFLKHDPEFLKRNMQNKQFVHHIVFLCVTIIFKNLTEH